MAGKYSRFREEGFKIPKYLLPWGNRTILSEILHQFLKNQFFTNVFLIANKEDEPFFAHVKKIMQVFEIPAENLIVITDTSGQAETAYKGIIEVHSKLKNEPLLIHNIDTVLFHRDLSGAEKLLKEYTGFIDLFRSNNHEYSYVVAENSFVKVIAEKAVISDTATSGLYGFGYADLFIKYYTGEEYISQMYKSMIADGHSIIAGSVHQESDTIVLGTPNEYLKHSQNLK
jgi:NDP-sugar pyrophosphorylase family protein